MLNTGKTCENNYTTMCLREKRDIKYSSLSSQISNDNPNNRSELILEGQSAECLRLASV